MARAWLRGPAQHARGDAYEVSVSVPPGEPALESPWAHFSRVDDDQRTFVWQCRADRMVLGLEAAARGDFDLPDLLQRREFKAFFEEVRDAYADEKELEDDLSDEKLWGLMAEDIRIGQLDLYDHMFFSRISIDDFEKEALRALGLPRWAEIDDARPEGKLMLVLTDGRTMDDVEAFLKTGRTPRRKRSVLWKHLSRSKRTRKASSSRTKQRKGGTGVGKRAQRR